MADGARHGIDMGPLLSSFGFLLRLAQVRNFEDFYAGFSQYGIRPGEYSALLIIQRNPGIRQGVLAQHLMIKRAHMTKMVRSMEDAGYVDRQIPDDDRRSVELRLTPAGAALVKRHLTHFTTFVAHEKATLTDEDEAELKRLLRKYLDLPEEAV